MIGAVFEVARGAVSTVAGAADGGMAYSSIRAGDLPNRDIFNHAADLGIPRRVKLSTDWY